MEIDDISNRIVDGARKALTEYKKWSGNYPVENYGSESIITSFIAQALMKGNKEHRLALEEQFSILYSNSKSVIKGRKPNIISDLKRADIVLYGKDNENNVLEHIIEVKKKFCTRSALQDIERMILLLEKISNKGNGTLKSGHFVYIEHIYEYQKDVLYKKLNIVTNDNLCSIKCGISKHQNSIDIKLVKHENPIYFMQKDPDYNAEDYGEDDDFSTTYYYLTPVCFNITLK